MLSPAIDFLFGRGLISFSDDGDLLVSKGLPADDAVRLDVASMENVGSFNELQATYLKYHRDHIFRSSQGD